ncbi:hypothetical protein, partial [Prevotella histicola]|uniref:hypothetical protein n=1 Tax=Prevotella histicola TaxID=470565 RepID=UPI0028EFF088
MVGRLPLTEQRVKADTRKYHSNNYLCDFMSHPRRVQMMDRNGTLLCIHTSTQHGCRAENNTNISTVH